MSQILSKPQWTSSAALLSGLCLWILLAAPAISKQNLFLTSIISILPFILTFAVFSPRFHAFLLIFYPISLLSLLFLSSPQLELWGETNIGLISAILYLVMFFFLSLSTKSSKLPSQIFEKSPRNDDFLIHDIRLAACFFLWLIAPAFLLLSSLQIQEKVLSTILWFSFMLFLTFQYFFPLIQQEDLERYWIRRELEIISKNPKRSLHFSQVFLFFLTLLLLSIWGGLWL